MKPAVDPETFKKRLQRYADEDVKQILVGIHKNIVRDLHRLILVYHPVDTSLSRGNWFPSIGTPSPLKTTSTAGVSNTGAGVTSAERGRLNAVLGTLDALPLGQIVWLTNNISYVKFLEAGTSTKAPAGILGPAAATVRLKLRGGSYGQHGISGVED